MSKLRHRLLLGLAAVALLAPGAQAADFAYRGGGADPIFNSPLFNFEGFYIGATAGAGAFPAPGVAGTVGVVAGANFEVTDAIIVGGEFQGDALWNGGGFVGFDALFLAKVGGYLTDDMLLYGSAGGGLVANVGSYAFGAGLEKALAQQMSVRGEVMATGTWGGGPNGVKASVGLLWHMN
jgi:outer membrane immunogenic protein